MTPDTKIQFLQDECDKYQQNIIDNKKKIDLIKEDTKYQERQLKIASEYLQKLKDANTKEPGQQTTPAQG